MHSNDQRVILPTPVQIEPSIDQPHEIESPLTSVIDGAPVILKAGPVASTTASVITAKAYLVGNLITGKVYVSDDASKPMPVASMSKLITAIAAVDMITSTSSIEVTKEEAMAPPDDSHLVAGERLSFDELMRAMLLSSSNVAAEAIASSSDRAAFKKAMSGYAWEIGMSHSYFADPSGVSPQNTASASDIFVLAQYLLKQHSDILAITRLPQVSMATTSDHGSHILMNIHPFVSDKRFIGGKTGRTPEAGETMLTILEIDEQPIAFIVLGSAYGTRAWDTKLLINRYEKMKK